MYKNLSILLFNLNLTFTLLFYLDLLFRSGVKKICIIIRYCYRYFLFVVLSFLFFISYMSKNIIVPMRLKEERGKQSHWVKPRGGPCPTLEGRKYDRDHMGYSQKVTSFSRT